MVIGIIAPPFTAVPPPSYGRTEVFVANLAEGLGRRGHQVIVYANGESKLDVEVCWIYPNGAPLANEVLPNIKDMQHHAWAMRDASKSCDVVHINSSMGLAHSSLVSNPIVFALPGAHNPNASDLYSCHPDVHYVCTSHFRAKQERMPFTRVIIQGIDLTQYPLCTDKKSYLCFLGRIAPMKGTHIAIAVSKMAGIPLKIAGPIQAGDQDYFNAEIKQHVDGRFVDYLGEVSQRTKAELLGDSLALLFPIQWDEPFGLVMEEAMACGTPVLAFAGGAVEETVKDGVNGYICHSVEHMALSAQQVETSFSAGAIRVYAEEHFSLQRMAESYEKLYSQIVGGSATGLDNKSDGMTKLSRAPGSESSAHKVVLCIDDNTEQLQLEGAILTLQGYDVLTATSGRAGLELLKQRLIDVVLLDYCMPEMNGGDIALEIRKMHLAVPIVVVSGSDETSLPELLFELINGFVPKGAPPDQLLSVVRQVTTTTALAA